MSESTTEAQPAAEDYTAILAEMREADAAPEVEAPEAEPVAEAEAVEPEQQPAEDERRKRGLIGELQEERKARREALEEAARERDERRKMADLVQRLMSAQEPPKQQAQDLEPPPIDADPVGHFKAEITALKQQLAAVREPIQQQNTEVQLRQHVAQLEQAFAAQASDYFDAAKHLATSLASEEQLMGLPAGTLAKNIATTALQNGRNPAEVAYQMAKARGYAKAAPAVAPARDTIDTLERGTQAARGVAAVAGTTPQGGLDLAAISKWSPEQFSQNYANPKLKAAIIRAMGG